MTHWLDNIRAKMAAPADSPQPRQRSRFEDEAVTTDSLHEGEMVAKGAPAATFRQQLIKSQPPPTAIKTESITAESRTIESSHDYVHEISRQVIQPPQVSSTLIHIETGSANAPVSPQVAPFIGQPERQEQERPNKETVVEIQIGRLEVRALPKPAPGKQDAVPESHRFEPRITLDDYLENRGSK